MLLDRLHIEAFRGIRNPIDIPLDASITILLAANGTAKTTVCDAAEWLMTGRVRRLQPGLVSAETLKNRYAANARVLVHATATWAGGTREIERTETETLQIPNARGAARKPTPTAKFLEQLTPQYVGQTSRSRNVEEPRADWLRAVRFFSPDGLTLLLDDGDDAERIRGIAFAELLGVGPIGRRIEGLKGVRAQIDSPRAAIANVLEKIAFHEARLKAEQASVSLPYLTRVDALLREVAVFCSVTLPETLLVRREALLSLRERLATTERALETQRAELTKVNGAFAQYETACDAWKKWLEEQKPILERTVRESQKERDEGNREIRQLITCASELTNRLGQLNVLLGQVQTAIATVRLDASAQDSPGEFAAAQTRAARDDALKKAMTAQTQLERWRRFADEFPQGHRAFLQLDILGKQRLELSQSIPSAEDQESVERRLRESTLSLTQLREQLNTNIDRWQRWGAEVRAQAPNWRAQSVCPLCGHDHGSPEQLCAAMDDVLSQQPSATPELANRLAQLESTVAELRANAATIAERRRQLLELEQKLAVQRTAFARFLENAQERGFDQQLFGRADAAEVVISRFRAAEEAATAAVKFAERLTVRAEDVGRWHSELNAAAQKLRAALPIQPSPTDSPPSDPSLENRLRDIEALIFFAQTQAEALRAQTEQAGRSAEEKRAKLATLDASIRHQQESFAPMAKSADDAKKFIESVEEAWRAVSAEPLDSPRLLRAAAFQQQRFEQIRENTDRLAQAEQHLTLAEQAIRDEADRNEATKAIAANKAEHAALLRVELLRTKLDSAIEAEEQYLNRLLSTQIRPLLRAISSFYLRAQGNPFIDSIGVDDNPNRNVLRWLGQLVDAQPLSVVEMSQGQRQDLALSIFLARARRERGSFILDEPLAHLDDLNRVAFFDTLRAMVAETSTHPQPFRLVITTASWSLVRHLRAKFSHVQAINDKPSLRVLELVGDPRAGIDVRQLS